MKAWQCSVCKYIHKGESPPDKCPICGVSASKFREIDEASVTRKTGAEKTTAKKETIEEPAKFEQIKELLVKHHLHPISVHTPNGIMPLTALLFGASWITGYSLLAKAAFINLVFVILVMPFVIFTGIVEWRKKYNGLFTQLFKIKIAAATITSFFSITSFCWYLINSDVLLSSYAWLFVTINIIILAAVGIAGHVGGKLVFKD